MDLLAGTVSALEQNNWDTGPIRNCERITVAINKFSPDLLSNTDGYVPSKLMLCLKLCISILALAIMSP